MVQDKDLSASRDLDGEPFASHTNNSFVDNNYIEGIINENAGNLPRNLNNENEFQYENDHHDQMQLPVYIPGIERHEERTTPGPKWIYQSNFDGHRHEHGSTVDTNEPNLQKHSSNATSSTIIIDPSQTMFIPTIVGEVVTPRRCYVKIFGFRLCDDNYPANINSSILVITFIIVLAVGITGGLLHSPVAPSKLESNNLPFTSSPSMMISAAPSFDTRTKNITEKLFSLSGDAILYTESPQNKALTWILYENGMNLSHESPNLVQRYVMMVFYYSMGGEKWTNSGGYGSGRDECGWYGIYCFPSLLKVRQVHIDNNNLAGMIPKEIGYLNKLEVLILQSNRISENIPSSIGMLPRLKSLVLNENYLSGVIPEEITNCRMLELLLLRANRLSGTIPSFLGDLHYIQEIVLTDNKLTGTIPSTLSYLQYLSTISFKMNTLSGTIPSELGMCQSLQDLHLTHNDLEGSIPSNLGNLMLLKRLHLHDNMLSGTIPKELRMLSKLNDLSLYDNMMDGTIPSELGLCQSIQVLYLDNNDLEGSIPSDLGNLMLSKRLHLYDNMLSGTIPEELGMISKLNDLSLHNNMMNGRIPSSLDNLNDLEILKLHYNTITGEVSEKKCVFSMISMTADCLGIEAKVSCSCCTECF